MTGALKEDFRAVFSIEQRAGLQDKCFRDSLYIQGNSGFNVIIMIII